MLFWCHTVTVHACKQFAILSTTDMKRVVSSCEVCADTQQQQLYHSIVKSYDNNEKF